MRNFRPMTLREKTHDSEFDAMARCVAKMEESMFGATERIAMLEGGNGRLREENVRAIGRRSVDGLRHPENGYKQFSLLAYQSDSYGKN